MTIAMEKKKCPKCEAEMTIGSPHDDRDEYQWECHRCGYIEGVRRGKIVKE